MKIKPLIAGLPLLPMLSASTT